MKSTQEDSTQNLRKGNHLSKIERQQIERWLKEKTPKKEIAQRLNRDKSTIYREIKRGQVKHINSDLTECFVYSWDAAQRNYEKNKGGGGRYPKIHAAHEHIDKLKDLIINHKLSPYAAMKVLQKQGCQLNFCEKTFYNYIARKNSLINWSHLPYGHYRKRKSGTTARCRKHKNLKGESIENRPEYINNREQAGHHEMDLVVCARGGKSVLLVITERLSRYQHVMLLKDKTQRSVIKAINKLERKYGLEKFSNLFKSITCDNGIEFQNFEGIEKSVLRKKSRRTKVYFAHPYSSYERGSNENANRLIRRLLPKGTRFDKLHPRDVQRLALWMNKYPRKLHGGKSAKEVALSIGLDF